MQNLHIFSIEVEILLDLIALALGIALIIKSNDNIYRKVWGWVSVIGCCFLLFENISWLFTYHSGRSVDRTLISIWIISRWFLVLNLFSMLVLASAKPGWMTKDKLILLSLPFAISTTIALSYMWFNGGQTEIHSISDIASNIGKTDVQIRLGYFAVSAIVPVLYIVSPLCFAPIRTRRRFACGKCIFWIITILSLCVYFLYNLTQYEWVIYIYGYVIVSGPIVFSLFCLHCENPLTLPPPTEEIIKQIEQIKQVGNHIDTSSNEAEVTPQNALQLKLINYLNQTDSFTNPNFSIENLVTALNASKKLLIDTLHQNGFASFNEFLNYIRIEHFKKLAAKSPASSVTTLMHQCGYTSRTTFYRQFAEFEQISPKEYIKSRAVNQPSKWEN